MSRTRFIYIYICVFLFGTWDTYVCVLDTGNNGGDLQAIVRGISGLGFHTGSPTGKQGEIFDPFSIKKCDLTRKI